MLEDLRCPYYYPRSKAVCDRPLVITSTVGDTIYYQCGSLHSVAYYQTNPVHQLVVLTQVDPREWKPRT